MLSIPTLLIPFTILCIGIIVVAIYYGIKNLYNSFYYSMRDELKSNVMDSVHWKVNHEVVRRIDELAKSFPENSDKKERFQKLAGIKAEGSPSGNTLADRFERVRFNINNM